jgi:hypothetical protein
MQMNKFAKEKKKHTTNTYTKQKQNKKIWGKKIRKLFHQNVMSSKNITINVKICKRRVGSMPT